jgi:uncharacterized membrane protein
MDTAFSNFALLQSDVHGLVGAPIDSFFEPTVVNLVSWLKLIIELTGATIIAIGMVFAFSMFVKVLLAAEPRDYNKIRLLLARYLALALEFQLGADILSTAISPSWDQIGKLGAIAIIRTALNYFLSLEMKSERGVEDGSVQPTPAGAGT